MFLEYWRPGSLEVFFFFFLMYSIFQSLKCPLKCRYDIQLLHVNTGALLIFGNTPIKILVLVINKLELSMFQSIEIRSLLLNACNRQTRRTQRTTDTAMLCHRCAVTHIDCKLYAKQCSNRHGLLQIHEEIWKKFAINMCGKHPYSSLLKSILQLKLISFVAYYFRSLPNCLFFPTWEYSCNLC